jgi:dTMP kinase
VVTLYIAFEGIDNCGKSTQIKLLYNYFKNNTELKVGKIKEPSNSSIGKFILEFLKSDEALSDTNKEITSLLFSADRLTQKSKILRYKNNPDNLLISDRSYISSICYQSNNHINTSWIEQLNKYIPQPDLTIILRIPVDMSIQRSSQDTAYETRKQLKRIQNNYLHYAMNHNHTYIVNGAQARKTIHKNIKKIIKKYTQNEYNNGGLISK